MGKPHSPCDGCKERTATCHAHCPRGLYDQFVKDLKEYNEKIIKAKKEEFDVYVYKKHCIPTDWKELWRRRI